MIMGMEAFFFVIQKRNRLQDPKTPRNRWFRWKDKLVSKILIYHHFTQIFCCNRSNQLSQNSYFHSFQLYFKGRILKKRRRKNQFG